MLTTQAKQWHETDTPEDGGRDLPDDILVSGTLASGAVASVHVAAVPWAGGAFGCGREGTLVATGNVSSQRVEMLRHRFLDTIRPSSDRDGSCRLPENPNGR
jgi:hypothetical protein